MKTFKCDSCKFLQKEIVKLHQNTFYGVKTRTHLTLFCEYSRSNLGKIKIECEHFKLKNGVVAKNAIQKTLWYV